MTRSRIGNIKKKIMQLMGFRDSMLVIQHVCKIKENSMQSQSSILHRISLQIENFKVVEFFHVKRHHNSLVNSLANKGVSLEQGMMTQDDKTLP